MDTEKRFVLAFTLCIIVILLHSAYTSRMRSQHKPALIPGQTVSEPYQTTPQPAEEQKKITQRKELLADVPAAQAAEETTTFTNNIYKAVLSNTGGGIKELHMLRYEDKEISPIQMSSSEPDELMVLGIAEPASSALVGPWKLVSNKGGVVVYTREGNGIRETKSISFDNDSYTIGLQLNVTNMSLEPVYIKYKIIGGQSILTDDQAYNIHSGVDVKAAGKTHRSRTADKKLIDGQVFAGKPEWASVRSRYFCFVLQASQPEQAAFIIGDGSKKAWSGIITEQETISPGASLTRGYTLYAGPNDSALLSSLGLSPKEILGYWVSSGIARVLLAGLRLSHNIFGNYGLGIVVLTMLIGIALFPLTRKTLESAKKTQQLQPEIEKIRKEYKDKPDKMNKEIMGLYRKHGVNPLGGCLPLFLQLPIFLSIFQILPRSIELRGASFLWIRDLSSVDALFTLPVKLPIISNNVNLLPILMAVATMIQQKLSHPGGDVTEQQRMMSFIMPVMLCFIFYNMPSCIVLYWLVNTITTLLIQEVVLKARKRQPA